MEIKEALIRERGALAKWYADKFDWDLYLHCTTRHDISDRLARFDFGDGDEIRGLNWRWGTRAPYRDCKTCKYVAICKQRVCAYKIWVQNPLDKIDINLVVGYWKRLISAINRRLYSNQYMRKRMGVSWVIGIETWNGKHTHIHGLIGGAGVDMLCRKCVQRYWEWCTGLRGGMARCEPFDKKRAERGAFYLAKHQIKYGNVRDFFVARTQAEREDIEEWISKRNENHPDSDTGLLHLYYFGKVRACDWGELQFKKHQKIRELLKISEQSSEGSCNSVQGKLG